MNKLQRLYWTAKGVGWDNLSRRLLQAWRKRGGYLKKHLAPSEFTDEKFQADCHASVDEQADLWADRAKRFFPMPSQESLASIADDAAWNEHVNKICQKALDGEYRFFSHWHGRLGWPTDFNLDPVNNLHWEVGRHWMDGPDSLDGKADIKLVWEASRFSLAYYFGRAYTRNGDEKWAESFWRMFDAWVEQNPCELTVNWRCGQEMTFRLMAMLWGGFATRKSPAATNERLYALSRLAWRTAKHINVNINGARMQGNNHALSEAVGLWTVGLLFSEFKQAGYWRDRGIRILAAEVRRQVYDDGSYVQHSMNYHRVMMDDLLWAMRLAEINDVTLPSIVRASFDRATNWLLEMIDPASGRVPNYGANDGASVLPLSCNDYLDYRPVAQAAYYLLYRKRRFEPGTWDEKALWLSGSHAAGKSEVIKSQPAASFAAPDGGYYILRSPNSWAMTRCHTYRHRPSQADMLHLDLWYKGINVLRDAGSYKYYCEQPWKDYFLSTAAHNTVEIDSRNQMTKGSRFLWFNWTKSKLLRFETSSDGRVGYFEGEHYGYSCLAGRVVHRRAICRIDDTYIIIDKLLGSGEHEVALRWRLCEANWILDGNLLRTALADTEIALSVSAPAEMPCRLERGEGAREVVQGWESLYYGRKEPVQTAVVKAKIALPVCLVTIVGRTDQMVDVNNIDFADPNAPLMISGSDQTPARLLREISGGRIRCE